MCKRRARPHEQPSLSTRWRVLCSLHAGANHSCRNDTQRTKSPTGRQSTTTISKTRRPSHRLMNRRPCPCAIRRATNDPNRHSLSETNTGCRSSFSITLRDRREFPADTLHACLLAIDVGQASPTFMVGGMLTRRCFSRRSHARNQTVMRGRKDREARAVRAYSERVGGRAFGKPETMPRRFASSCLAPSARSRTSLASPLLPFSRNPARPPFSRPTAAAKLLHPGREANRRLPTRLSFSSTWQRVRWHFAPLEPVRITTSAGVNRYTLRVDNRAAPRCDSLHSDK
jgi:hypothetical protein